MKNEAEVRALLTDMEHLYTRLVTFNQAVLDRRIRVDRRQVQRANLTLQALEAAMPAFHWVLDAEKVEDLDLAKGTVFFHEFVSKAKEWINEAYESKPILTVPGQDR
jgi:hypothetical protein